MTRLGLSLIVVLALPGIASARTWTVNPGQSIQETIDKAEPGDTIQVLPGQFPESIRIGKENLRVVGMSYEGERCELLGEDELETGITVAANGVTVEGFVLRGFTSAGLAAHDVSDLTLTGLNVYACGHTNIELENVTRAEIVDCVVRTARLHGLRVYRSQEIRIADGEFSDTWTGIYLFESVQTVVENNAVYGNYRGIAIESVGSAEHPAEYAKIRYNRIAHNDRHRIWMDSSEGITSIFGFGIEVRNADHVEIAHNHIEDNAWLGVMVHGSLNDEADASTASPQTSDHAYVHHNTYARNGEGMPPFETKASEDDLPKGDIYFDGKGERNQFQESQDLTTHPEDLVQKLGGVHTEVIHFL